jgi:hypothetical protein
MTIFSRDSVWFRGDDSRLLLEAPVAEQLEIAQSEELAMRCQAAWPLHAVMQR